MPSPYINTPMRAFSEDGGLCLASLETVYRFAPEEIRAIRTVEKPISFPEWNKPVAPDDEIYKPYAIRQGAYGMLRCSSYHTVEIERDGERFELRILPYDLPIVERLTGLTAERTIQS